MPGNDVQYPSEPLAVTVHATHNVDLPSLYFDTTPVTDAAYATFLTSSGYPQTPTTSYWTGRARARPPQMRSRSPSRGRTSSTHVLRSAHYGKRLPEDWEWQYAGQSGAAGALYPYGGDKHDASAFPPQQTGTERPLPPDVGSYPQGDRPTASRTCWGPSGSERQSSRIRTRAQAS
jgi:formylglycine-generating enzyme required for sulfatase activity